MIQLIISVFIISLLILVVIKILTTRKKKTLEYQNQKIQREKQEYETYNPQIEAYFSDFYNQKDKYITNRDKNNFLNKWNYLSIELNKLNIKETHPLFSYYSNFKNNFYNINNFVVANNRDFFNKQNSKYDYLLSNIDGKSLDYQQREVVISDEDNTLVLAGAGSGKTLTISAKVKYLCEAQNIKPNEILLLSFTNKSAEEMTERIQTKLGIPLEATTFHKLGLNIIKSNSENCPEVIGELNSFVNNFFENNLLNHQDLIQKLTEYFTYYLDIPEDLENCSSLGELYELEKSADLETLKSKYEREKFIDKKKSENAKSLTTLNGEKVKSIEETKIANFLFMHGINYEYEKTYPYESDTPERKSYHPDFYLTDYDIYLEHFGITRDYRLPWLSPIEEKKYLDGIEWKRNFHKEHGTKLIETYSYYTKEGILLTKLEELLLANDIVFKPHDFNDIFETIYAKKSDKYFSEFIKLCCSFIVLYKSNNYNEEQFEVFKEQARSQENNFIYERTCLFMDIVKIIYKEYQNYLTQNNAIDFSDMINLAAEKVINGANIQKYKYIIVDEYQDISQARFNLLKSIINATNAKLLCVGDDWQSIYRFAGSDINLFTDFERNFGYTNLLRIEKTYRNSQELIDEASEFILKNPLQLKKNLISDEQLNYPLVFWGYDDEPYNTLDLIIKKIISEFGNEKSILFLGRTNYDIEVLKKSGLFKITRENRNEKLIYIKSPATPVSFLSVHKSKGLEADNVVILNFKNDKIGFPNQISDDKVLNYVLVNDEKYLFAEERRLFYVAITRTKNRTFILTDNKSPSIFFKEFSESEKVCFISTNKTENKEKTKCPRCITGDLLKIDKNGKKFIGCSNFPKCRYTLNDISILSSPKKCPECGGFLVKRKSQKNRYWFIGCTNYPYCTHTEKLEKNI